MRGTAILEFELTHPFTTRCDLGDFDGALVLCRLHGRSLGFVQVPVDDGRLAPESVVRALLEQHAPAFTQILAERAIAAGRPPRWLDLAPLIECNPDRSPVGPTVTVAVYARGHRDLAPCLDAIRTLDYPHIDTLVLDASPTGLALEDRFRGPHARVRIVAVPGADVVQARSRAVTECQGEILAFVDDDVVVDAKWASALVRLFLADTGVMGVTGLVLPGVLGSQARHVVQADGHSSLAVTRTWFRAPGDPSQLAEEAWTPACTGAGMAFWREALDEIGPFEAAAEGAGGHARDMFARLLKRGHTVVYEPSAIVRRLPPLEIEAVAEETPLAATTAFVPLLRGFSAWRHRGEAHVRCSGEAERAVDLASPLRPIVDATAYAHLRVQVSWDGRFLGAVRIAHQGAVVSARWLTDAIAQGLATEVLDARTRLGGVVVTASVVAGLARLFAERLEVVRREELYEPTPTGETDPGTASRHRAA